MESQTFSAEQIVKASLTALERELGRAHLRNPDIVPAGFRTAKEWSASWGKQISQTKIIISMHLNSGRMECKKFNRADSRGTVKPAPFYRAVK